MLDCLILHSLNGENSNNSIAVLQREVVVLLFFLALPKNHKTDAKSEELRWEQKFCGLTAVSKKFLFGLLLGRWKCARRLVHRFPPRPAPILGRENIFRLGRFLRFARFWARTCVLSQPLRSFSGMTSLTPTSQTDRSAPGRSDPSDLLYLTLRFASSAYLASERFVMSSQTPDPEPPTALHSVPRRTPRLIVGQALDRMAA